MPPPRNRKVRTLEAGTVRLSKPMGEKLSTKVAATAVARAGKIFSRAGNGYNVEKNARLIVKLMKLARNIAAEPSRVFSSTSLYLLFPYAHHIE